ncbi:acyl-CoA carboxylase subunit epsilon [Kineosporia sp. J2-2]|uniref:Acyl-CoA carboxylase subunit epsilon n=1 Tax=Kineosporia corallincola TaxID=2835133 RepID=A0ABS5TA98_9ACTN|nr:acyl-CoA carboxylase subunit epsilon [Kineosporia corallincola]MBT0767992.1 acyl-CoA carboxylase subunit epsilon [Kineosporia corallincola]
MLEDDAAGPVLRVVRGNPTPEELAALLAVMTAVRAAGSADPGSGGPGSGSGGPGSRQVGSSGVGSGSAWNDRAALVRRPVAHGAGVWRASGWSR